MKVEDRIKLLRNELSMNQSEFAQKMGIGQAALSAIEKGIRNVTDRNIMIVCKEFNINEVWLRTGDGKMFKENNEDDFYFNIGLKSKELDEIDRELILSYIRMDESQRSVIKNWFRSTYNK